jgi:hypothetical protein
MAELTKQTITVEHVTLVRRIRTACLNSPNRFPAAAGIASELGLSLRTFHRRLAQERLSYQSVAGAMPISDKSPAIASPF